MHTLSTGHPPWCSPPRCTANTGGVHRSAPQRMDYDPHTGSRAAMSLWQGPPGRDGRQAPVRIALAVADGGAANMTLTLGQARQLRLGLTTLLDATKDAPCG